MDGARPVRRLALVAAGSAVSAYGITLAIGAGFGGGTLAVLWQGVARTFGLTLGQASFAVAALMIAFSLAYDKRQIGLGTVLYQVVYGLLVDAFSGVHGYVGHPFADAALMAAGIVLFAAGTGLYASTDTGRGSYEAVTFSLSEKNGWPVGRVRVVSDAAVVALGVLLGGELGLCTVCMMLASGPVIQRSARLARRWLLGCRD
ncbi:hypothetical protein B5F40_03985 [Gordonibacter sp. An230]|nr:hypothetical protein B5F40_03985 [Gordonibacter sp. An230]